MSESERQSLAERMVARAKADGLAPEHELCTAARDLSKAITAYFQPEPEINVKEFIGRYARASRIWRDYIGEPLIR